MFDLFEFDFKKILLVVLMLALPLISLNLERRETGNIRWYDQPVLWIVNPTQEFFTRFARSVSHTTEYYLNLLDVKKDNRLLKEEVLNLKQQLTQRDELKIENDRLKNQLHFQQTSPNTLVSAQVVAMDLLAGTEYSSLRINKGSQQGIKKRMGVITHEGVVGYILNVSPSYATVLVLTDRNAVIDSIVQRSRARGIVEGVGSDLCQIKYLQRTDDVQNGDVIVTSGYDGIFPKGFPVGHVTKVSKKAYGVTQNVEMSPTVDVTRLEEVFVVATAEKEEVKK